MQDRTLAEPGINKPLLGVAGAVVLAAFGGWYYWHARSAPGAKPPPTPAPVVQTAPPDAPIEHPVPAAGTDAPNTPLPSLADSDSVVRDALEGASPGSRFSQYLVPENLVRHIVVTVDNLPRQKAAADKRPTTPVGGSFMSDGDELHSTLDAQNFQRYRPMVEALAGTDMRKLAAVYLHFYPLFQKVYQDLGYPNGYFNDRLVQVIDVLLAAPQVAAPIELVRPDVLYVFADTALEGRPAGQKMLIRLGPDNAAVVKAKLMELRALVTAAPPRR
jgi:hypothetical protein